MATTTIRITEELKARVAAAAEKAGSTPHGFILEAIAEKAEQSERSAGFHEQASQRFERIVDSGKTVPWSEIKQYLQDRVSGKESSRPKSRKMAR